MLYGLLFIMRMERFCNLKRGCKREDLLFAPNNIAIVKIRENEGVIQCI